MEEQFSKESRYFYELIDDLINGDLSALLESHEPLFPDLEWDMAPVVSLTISIALLIDMINLEWVPIEQEDRISILSQLRELIIEIGHSDEFREHREKRGSS